MHPITRMLLLIVVIALFSYLAVAFVLWNTDLSSWGFLPRLGAIVCFVLWLTLSDYGEAEEDEEGE